MALDETLAEGILLLMPVMVVLATAGYGAEGSDAFCTHEASGDLSSGRVFLLQSLYFLILSFVTRAAQISCAYLLTLPIPGCSLMSWCLPRRRRRWVA